MADLLFGYTSRCADLGQARGYTPMSVIGPCCSGDLLSLSERQLPDTTRCALVYARSGAVALHFWPLAPAHWRSAGDTSRLTPEQWQALGDRRPCPLCLANGIQDTTLDPWHIFCECPTPALISRRAEVWSGLSAVIADIARLAAAAMYPGMPPAPSPAVTALLPLSGMASTEARFLLHRFLVGMPWPAAVAPHCAPGGLMVAALGALFDEVQAPNHRIRPIANLWISWASKHCYSLGRCWADEVERRSLPTPAAYP